MSNVFADLQVRAEQESLKWPQIQNYGAQLQCLFSIESAN